MNDSQILDFLKNYDGPEVRIMEICGSHTAAIAKSGIRSVLSPQIHMISGPGCPVCVTVTAYIDKLIELAMEPENVVVTFGDLIRVPGSVRSMGEAKALGARIEMAYSPLDMLDMAEKDAEHTYIFAAVGFETTTPVYAMLLSNAEERGISNIKILTSLKTMPAVVDWVSSGTVLAEDGSERPAVDGYIAPGHVCAVSGYQIFEHIAEKHAVPFVASNFEAKQILAAIFALVKLKGRGVVKNLYGDVVTREGNLSARAQVSKYFEAGDGIWRGMGTIAGSAMYLRPEYERFDAGSRGLDTDHESNGCHCSKIITGEEDSTQCPLFRRVCTPEHPKGACMVSQEGACFNRFISGAQPRSRA
ncbi:hydrogenase expression/formation protein HypD [Lachnospiraceae bacterium]|nr:hydrogenase expression/formation protein HypD [Lachnospiraceae bacterium]